MLGRKDYTQTELASGRAAVASQLATFANVAGALGAKADKKAQAVREEFEAVYFNNMVLVLDRLFVHRIRQVAGKDGTPLNELELLAESLMNNNGIFRGNSVLKYAPEKSVVQLTYGDSIRLSADQFRRLAAAVFEELDQKFR